MPKSVKLSATMLYTTAAFVFLEGACGGQEPGKIDRVESELRNGNVVNAWTEGPAYARAVVSVPGCTATVIRPSWVLTASHCDYPLGTAVQSLRPNGAPPVTRTIDFSISAHSRQDLRLLHLNTPFTDVPQSSLYQGTTASLSGTFLHCYGYGRAGYCGANGTCPAGQTCVGGTHCQDDVLTLRYGGFVAATNSTYPNAVIDVPENASGQSLISGDSGGPCFKEPGVIAGVHGSGSDGAVTPAREWLTTPSRVAFTSGEFNGDGKTDIVITTAAGSEFFLSTGTGTWSWVYSRPDFSTDKASFTPADFNGDGLTDLFVTTPNSLQGLYANGLGGFVLGYHRSNPEFKLGMQQFVIGDFNGDQQKDFALVASIYDPMHGGTFWNFSYGGNFNHDVYIRPDLDLLNVAYTPGDFNGDGKTDLVITTSGGSAWYSWDGASWVQSCIRPDLPLGAVTFTPGNFNTDTKTDLVITTASGSGWYHSTGLCNWNTPFFSRADLTEGKVGFATGDFNGDGRDDVVATGGALTGAGSVWYYSNATGVPSAAYGRPDLTRGNVMFTVGDFNGDTNDDMVVTTASDSKWYYSTGTGTWNQAYTLSNLRL